MGAAGPRASAVLTVPEPRTRCQGGELTLSRTQSLGADPGTLGTGGLARLCTWCKGHQLKGPSARLGQVPGLEGPCAP